jgi:hypothetical protein
MTNSFVVQASLDTICKTIKAKRVESVAQVAEYLLSNCKALSSTLLSLKSKQIKIGFLTLHCINQEYQRERSSFNFFK